MTTTMSKKIIGLKTKLKRKKNAYNPESEQTIATRIILKFQLFLGLPSKILGQELTGVAMKK